MFITDQQVPCKQHDLELWFSGKEDGRATRKAKAFCASCPFRRPCLRETLAGEEQRGKVDKFVAGGKTFRERGKILKARAARRAA